MYAGSGVPTEPVVSVDRFPELAKLRDIGRLRDEAVKLFDEALSAGSSKEQRLGFLSFFKNGWKRFYLKCTYDFLPSARTLCRRRSELFEFNSNRPWRDVYNAAAGGKLGAHRDPFAGSLRYHLDWLPPFGKSRVFLVYGVECVWRDGRLSLSTRPSFTAQNATDVNRIILFCDVERPMKYGFMTAINRWGQPLHRQGVCDPERGRRERRRAEQGVRRDLRGSLAGQRVKKRNLKFYYTLKYSVTALVSASSSQSALR